MKFFRNKKLFVIAAITLILCTALLILFRSYIGINPFREMETLDIADVDISVDGHMYLLTDSGTRLVKVNPAGSIDFMLEGNSDFKYLFKRGLQVTDDANGNIYIHNRVPSKAMSSAIGEESVVVFSKYGVYKGTYLDQIYDEPLFRPQIVELQNIGGSVSAIIASDSEIILEDILTHNRREYQLENANLLAAAAAYNEQDGCVYIVSRDGRILRNIFEDNKSSDDAGDFSVIYEVEDGDEKMIPADIAVDADGRVFVADVGNDEIFEITDDGAGETVSVDIKPIKITASHLSEMLIGESTDTIAYVDNNGMMQFNSFGYSALVKTIAIFCYILLLINALLAIYMLIFVVVIVFVNSSDRVKTIGTYGSFAIALTALFCIIMHGGMKGNAIENELAEEMHNAVLINYMIDADDFAGIRECRDFNSEAYAGIREACENAILNQGKNVSNRYAILYTLEENDAVYVRYSTEQNYGCNYPYIWTDGTDERELYDTGEFMTFDDLASDPTGTFLVIYAPLTDDENNVVGIIEVGCDYDELISSTNGLVWTIGISLFVMMIVVLMIVLELIEYNDAKKNATIVGLNRERKQPSLKMLRLVVFIVFFITNLSTPFLSIYALELAEKYNGFLSLSPEILAAIPISSEVLFGAVFSILGNSFIDKMNVRKTAFLGGYLFVGGLLIRCLYPDLWVLTIGNGVMGAGWGVLLLIVNASIAAEEDPEQQEEGFTHYNIALQNGINTGVVAGGFALVFLDHLGVLIASTIISFSMLIFISRYMFDKPVNTEKDNKSSGIVEMIKFMFSPKVLMYFLFIVIPVIAASYYLNFLYPIIGADLGMSETNIGYSYLANGLVTIVFSNVIVKFVTRRFSDRMALFLASGIYLITFVLVGVWTNIPMLIAALILLPVSDSFGYVIQETYYSRLKETGELGYEKAMGVYSLIENLSQTIGSFVFGYILLVGVTKGMIVFGITIGLCGLIFLIGSGIGEKRAKED